MKEQFSKVLWAKYKEDFKQQYGEHPSVISTLFVIGLGEIEQELTELTKEQKQEVIHVGLCTLLENQGFYERLGVDEDGWPHFEVTAKAETVDIEKQEPFLRQQILNYFNYE